MMNSLIHGLLFSIIFLNIIQNILAVNQYFVISVKGNSEFGEYDKANKEIQNKFDDLVNDRMNEIYNLVLENKASYGKDKILDETEIFSNLRKRSNDKFKILFINNNRKQEPMNTFSLNSINDEEVEFIPLKSKLVIHICPILDYYTIIAYLSEYLVEKVLKLPNIISCTKSKKLSPHQNHDNKYYNEEEILKETQWEGISIQENKFDFELKNTALSMMSQGKYFVNSSHTYDNNYYYPSSAGQGIDIYVIDDGLDVSLSEENFDTYKGSPDERTITCDGIFFDGQIHTVSDSRKCFIEINGKDSIYGDFNHGTAVAISALGTLNGIAKKANLHALAIEYYTYDILTALDHVKQYAKPHKSVVNISSGIYEDEADFSIKEIQDKINELNDYGIILVVSAGNSSINCCKGKTGTSNRFYGAVDGVIKVGAINNRNFSEFGNMESLYEIASYSNFGHCVDLFAPGTITITDKNDKLINYYSGTSFAAPFVSGLAATIMAEHSNIKYNFESLREKLIELALPDVIRGLNDETPNRLANNGKRSIYGPSKCNDISKENHCGDKCCSKYGFCVDPMDDEVVSMCFVENGCESQFGYCTTTTKCGQCSNNECCSKNGNCVRRSHKLCLIENGCQTDFGNCSTKKCGEQFNQRKCGKNECCSKERQCINVFHDEKGVCFLENGCLKPFSDKCLSLNLSDWNANEDEKYIDVIHEYQCKQEINNLEKYCSLNQIIHKKSSYDPVKRGEICNIYREYQCSNIINSLEEYFPNCFNNDLMYMVENFMNDIIYNSIYCSRRNSSFRDDYCITNNDRMSAIHDNLSNIIINDLCIHDECRESYLNILKNDYKEMKISLKYNKNDKLLKTLKIYEKAIELMSSKQCEVLAKTDLYLTQ